jgi:hypothetical protein
MNTHAGPADAARSQPAAAANHTRGAAVENLSDEAPLQRSSLHADIEHSPRIEAQHHALQAAFGSAYASKTGRVLQRRSSGPHIPSTTQPIQRVVPANAIETAAADAALDTLLGAGHPARGAVLAAAATVAALTAAVAAIATAVPGAADRILLANDVRDADELNNLLQAADRPGFGTPGVRLRNVLAENPGVVRTVAALGPMLTAKGNLDQKVLEGAQSLNPFVPATLGPGQVATGAGLNLVGGHSDHVLNPASFHAVPSGGPAPASGARNFSIRKVLRADTAGVATAIHNNAPGNLATVVAAGEQAARAVATAVPAVVLPGGFAGLPVPAQTFWNARVLHYGNNVAAMALAAGPVAGLVAAVRTSATACVNAVGPAAVTAALATFVDDVRALFNQVDNVIVSARTFVAKSATVNNNVSVLAYENTKQNFLTQGPAMSVAKDSTVPPVGWTDDQVLQAGHLAIQQPARWVETWPLPTGTVTQTLHQAVVPDPAGVGPNVVWNAVKDGVTFTTPPAAYAGGNVLGFWPTVDAGLPALPAPGVALNHWYTAP